MSFTILHKLHHPVANVAYNSCFTAADAAVAAATAAASAAAAACPFSEIALSLFSN